MKVYPLQGFSTPSLAERYRLGDEQVKELFGSHPGNEEDWQARAAYLDESENNRADRTKLVAALRDYQARLVPGERIEESLKQLEQGALAVVGGQQAGLFGGALLIVYKALSVIQTAKEASVRLNRPVVPIFWIAGEDHDFDEANHLYVACKNAEPRKIRLNRPEGPRNAVSRTSLSPVDWEIALTELAITLPDTEFKPDLLQSIRKHLLDAPTLTLAFARLLSEWFGEDGLVLLDADDPALRALEAPMFRSILERNEEISTALAEGSAEVKALGFPLQAESDSDGANLFIHDEQGRTLLFRRNGRYEDRRGDFSCDRETLLSWTSERPEVFSNNALTRPLMQDFLLPVLATVLGPSEIAYWAVLQPAFALLKMRMPLLVPRQSFTYLEPSVAKLLDKYGVTAEAVMQDGDRLKAEWLSSQDQWNMEARFNQAREEFSRLYAPIVETVGAVDPGLSKLGETNRELILEQISYLEQRAQGALAKKHEAALKHWDRMIQALWPLDKPQERVYGTLHYLNRYGIDWLKALSRLPYDALGEHRIFQEHNVSQRDTQEACCI